jgi:dolichol-phosphate mannosyltransferase
MISVILPTFNEALNIEEMIRLVEDNISLSDEVIIVDDNSPDGTADIVRGLQKEFPNINLVVRTEAPGLTPSIQRGVEESKGDIVIWMDCDLSQPPNKIPELINKINEGFDIVVASRYVKDGGDIRGRSLNPIVMIQVLLSFTLRVLTSFILCSRFADWSSGYIALKRKAIIELLPLEGDYGEYFIVMIYRGIKKGFRVTEIPYKLIARQRGESKTATNIWGLIRRGRKYLYTVMRLRLGG